MTGAKGPSSMGRCTMKHEVEIGHKETDKTIEQLQLGPSYLERAAKLGRISWQRATFNQKRTSEKLTVHSHTE